MLGFGAASLADLLQDLRNPAPSTTLQPPGFGQFCEEVFLGVAIVDIPLVDGG